MLRGCLETLWLGQAIEHDARHGDVNPSLVGAGKFQASCRLGG